MTDTEFTVQPFADTEHKLDSHHLDAILQALENDPRAIGPVVGYDYDRGRVNAIFQVEAADDVGDATGIAVAVFDEALAAAKVRTTNPVVAVVRGSDPDLLP